MFNRLRFAVCGFVLMYLLPLFIDCAVRAERILPDNISTPGFDGNAPNFPKITKTPLRLSQAAPAPGVVIRKDCGEAEVTVSPLSAGRTSVVVVSPCRAYTLVTFDYGGWSASRFLDSSGRAQLEIDCFAGDTAPIDVSFQDGASVTRRAVARDMKKVSKVAVIWRSDVDLDLHAFEFGAIAGSPSHVWAGAPSDLKSAKAGARSDGRGKGFLSMASKGNDEGDKLEVYTFWHGRMKRSGVVKMVVDFKSRGSVPKGEYCGQGKRAEIVFETVVTVRNTEVERTQGAFAPAPCNVSLEDGSRYNSKTVPDLVITN